MGAGASANGGDATIFTSLKDEMEKPRDGSDVATPRGVSALEEVKRLRGLLASKTAEAGDEHGEAGEHRMRMKKVKRKLSITEDFQSRSPKKVHEASRRQFHSPEGKVRKTLRLLFSLSYFLSSACESLLITKGIPTGMCISQDKEFNRE